MVNSIQDRNNNKFGEHETPIVRQEVKIKKQLSEEMISGDPSPQDYIEQGYRCYRVIDFDPTQLAHNLPNMCRRNKWEMMVIKGIIYIKDTKRYDTPRNPYT